MPIDYIVCMGIASVAAFSDFKFGKISNCVVFPAFFLGLLWSLSKSGCAGLLDGFAGGVVPLVLFPFFIIRMLGAGDIKLLMALGSWLGFENCNRVIVLSILWGGMMAFAVMVVHGNFAVRFKKLKTYTKACLLGHGVLPYQDISRMERGSALPFALAVLLGLVYFCCEVS